MVVKCYDLSWDDCFDLFAKRGKMLFLVDLFGYPDIIACPQIIQVVANYLHNAVFAIFYFQFQLICNFRSELALPNEMREPRRLKSPEI